MRTPRPLAFEGSRSDGQRPLAHLSGSASLSTSVGMAIAVAMHAGCSFRPVRWVKRRWHSLGAIQASPGALAACKQTRRSRDQPARSRHAASPAALALGSARNAHHACTAPSTAPCVHGTQHGTMRARPGPAVVVVGTPADTFASARARLLPTLSVPRPPSLRWSRAEAPAGTPRSPGPRRHRSADR